MNINISEMAIEEISDILNNEKFNRSQKLKEKQKSNYDMNIII